MCTYIFLPTVILFPNIVNYTHSKKDNDSLVVTTKTYCNVFIAIKNDAVMQYYVTINWVEQYTILLMYISITI